MNLQVEVCLGFSDLGFRFRVFDLVMGCGGYIWPKREHW